MIKVKVENIVASTIFADKLDLDMIAQTLKETSYTPKKFPGIVYRLAEPKTATLLFRSGKANCTGAKTIEDVKLTVKMVGEKLEKIGVKVNKNPKIEIQNMVVTADLGGRLNLSNVAMTVGLDNIEYEPELFPGLVYRQNKLSLVFLLFASGKIVCAGGKKVDDVILAANRLFNILTSKELFLS
jgi:transcription initiation factor TFIID TATA-box-binding protein